MTKNVTIRKNSQQNKYSKWSQGGAFTTGGVKTRTQSLQYRREFDIF